MPAPKVEARLPHASLEAGLRETFTQAEIYRVMFPRGHMLFKLSHDKALDTSGRVALYKGRVTPWWFSYETVRLDTGAGKYELPGIVDPVARAGAIRADLRTFLRSRAAVSWDWKIEEEWNLLDHLLIVKLTRAAVGVVGTCSGQKHGTPPDAQGRDYDGIMHIGGARQVYLPVLGQKDVEVVEYGRV